MIDNNNINTNRKGVIMAGGYGTRLSPLTDGVCKQLLPVYDKPMIYYPISVLMLSGIREILIISSPHDTPLLKRTLGDGSRFGVDFSYEVQEKPDGLAQAFIIGERFLKGSPATFILGDNLIFGQDLTKLLHTANSYENGATIFGYRVNDPRHFGVVEFDGQNKIVSIEEKPQKPKSSYAIPGIYFYDGNVSNFAHSLHPSSRGELEITDLNVLYLSRSQLRLQLLGRGTAWLDMGTHETLHKAACFVESVQAVQGYQIANLDEIAFRKSWINEQHLSKNISKLGKSSYRDYLLDIIKDPGHIHPHFQNANDE